MTSNLNIKRLQSDKKELSSSFAKGDPFPYLILDEFLDKTIAEKLLQEHKEQGSAKNWGAYNHVNERKSGITEYNRMGMITKSVIEELSSDWFLRWLEEITGIKKLVSDPDLDGGGLHMIERGGFLNVHVDFLAHTTRKSWSRQLNLLVYLNKDWKDSWGGALELWDKQMTHAVQKIPPIFNRCVIFQTCEGSYHGHPTPLNCPEDVQRRSLALYYFRDEGHVQALRPTHYSARPDDGILKRFLIAIDRKALGLYTLGKRYIGMKDGLVQKLLRFF